MCFVLGPPEGAWLGRFPSEADVLAALKDHGAPATIEPLTDEHAGDPSVLRDVGGEALHLPAAVRGWAVEHGGDAGGGRRESGQAPGPWRAAWEPVVAPDWVAVTTCGRGEGAWVSVFATATGESFLHLKSAGEAVGCGMA